MAKTQTKRTSQYKKASKRLLSRINKEFDKKFFIGDIIISDQEYSILLDRAFGTIVF